MCDLKSKQRLLVSKMFSKPPRFCTPAFGGWAGSSVYLMRTALGVDVTILGCLIRKSDVLGEPLWLDGHYGIVNNMV